jgi:hypothetical protein
MDIELWHDIKGYEGLYQVSNLGRVKSLERKHKIILHGKECLRRQKEHILKQWKRSVYFLVDLWKDGRRDIRSVHHLVYEAFNDRQIGGFFVHHKDENKENNCADNLELMTVLEHNRHHFCGKHPKIYNKLSPESYKLMWKTRHDTLRPRNLEIISLANMGVKVKELADRFNICRRQIHQILKEKDKWLILS